MQNPPLPPKAAWEMVCLPKTEGGLGVLNLRTQNEALLLKHLHKFFNRADVPWVRLIWEVHYGNGKLPNSKKVGSFWWRDIVKLLDSFKGMAVVELKDGASCLFWDIFGATECLKFSSLSSIPFLETKIFHSRILLMLLGQNQSYVCLYHPRLSNN